MTSCDRHVVGEHGELIDVHTREQLPCSHVGQQGARRLPAVEAVQVTMTNGELSVLALACSETSTAAQRQHAREVLHGYVAQAFDAIAEAVVHGRR